MSRTGSGSFLGVALGIAETLKRLNTLMESAVSEIELVGWTTNDQPLRVNELSRTASGSFRFEVSHVNNRKPRS